ncbi:ubiquinone/menaquinone biosynthesis C-methylase UbiE [Bradyrhizobium sp. cir1]|uniref:methyltransferase domain-containing protein n=1 Tax=Bradyrhizobium sp. cir1 TaxID=1445730 RepID=UPI0017D92BF2|nr:methyltransferase domain-containing protein [Bradyrhizobium sp. cir1]MBB4367880.1 ubiquinone/menaquinone biosynthesis C-methylase UbiE [Bradyrhizobium sp. cir1]
MSGMEYSNENAKRLQRLYLTGDVKAQRAETIRQLDLSAGERVLDIGCGPGYLCESMAEPVGPHGSVVGIDVSTDLIAVCNRQKASEWISYAVGNATELDQRDAWFDAVVCTQVAEHVPDVDRVLIEAFRVLKPGGRAIFVATDWDAVVWHSDNRERMASVMKSWEAHCAHPRLPRSMASRLVNAGFHLDGASVFPILNLRYDDESYSKGLAQGIRDFVGRTNDVSADDLNAWHSEFEHLAGAGQYFFSTNRYIFKASKPAGAPT